MVTTITLPPSALGFSLDSNNQYKISVTLVMKEIIKLIKDLSVNSYLKHHKIKYRYTFYINGTKWKYIDNYSDLTNTNVSFNNEDISGYLSSDKVKQTLSCTVEVSHPQFYCKLNSESYTFVVINQNPAQLKAKNRETGNYETIGLSFNDLSSGTQTDLNEIRWPIFNTENSTQQFVIPLGRVSSTRRNGSIRAERFGGAVGQYFNLDTNPNSNDNFRNENGTEYRYSDAFSPTFRYYESYKYVGTHSLDVDSYYWTNNTSNATPTLNTGSNDEGRYTSYSFGGWERQYTFAHSYFKDGSVSAPHAQYIRISDYPTPITSSLPSSAYGFSKNDSSIYTWGRDFTISYTDAYETLSNTNWPSTSTFTTGGSVVVSGEYRYSSEMIFDRWNFDYGHQTYYDCSNRYYDSEISRYYYSTPRMYTPTRENDSNEYYSSIRFEYVEVPSYGYGGVRYYSYISRYGYSYYERWTKIYKNKYLGYYFYLSNSYTTKSSTITGRVAGNEYVYKRWWQYENRTNWSIDSNNELRYSTDNQRMITNDKYTYKTS
jgi:hypothetical protein